MGETLKTNLRGAAMSVTRVRDALLLRELPNQPADLPAEVPKPTEISMSSADAPGSKDIGQDPHVRASYGRVGGSVIVSGWSTSDIGTSTASHAVSRAIAVAMDEKFVSLSVQVLQANHQEDEQRDTTSVKFDFEVVPNSPVDASRTVLDRLEAKLVLIGMVGGQAAQHFDKALAAALISTHPRA